MPRQKQKQKNNHLGTLACALAFSLWGLNTPLIVKSMATFPLFSLLFVKFLFGTIVFMLLAARHWEPVPSKLLLRIMIATIFGYVLNAILFYKGLKLTGGLNASLIYLLAPLILYFCSIRFLRERYNHKLFLSVITGFVGTILIVGAPLLVTHNGTKGSLLGNVLIILAVATDVAGTILIKPTLKKVPTLQMTALRFVIATIILAPFMVHEIPQLAHMQLNASSNLALGYNLVFATLIAFYLYHWGFKKISGEQMSPLQYLDPTIGAIASIIILAERPAPTTVVGIVLVFWGLYLSGVHRLKLTHHISHHR